VLPAGIVFDLDGTIVDTETVEYESIRLVWAEHGHSYAVGRFVQVIGTTDDLAWESELEAVVGHRLDHGGLTHRRQEHRRALLDRLCPRPGVAALVAEAANAGVPLAVASNSPHRWVEARLEQVGLRGAFDVVVSRDVASRPKPDPAPYVEACALLGAAPSDCIAVEDSATGTVAARAAGCLTVACPGPLTTGHELGAAHVVVESLDGVGLAVLAAWMRDR
jgi:HAD superfamily hydrolase (TIGR01509 family)